MKLSIITEEIDRNKFSQYLQNTIPNGWKVQGVTVDVSDQQRLLTDITFSGRGSGAAPLPRLWHSPSPGETRIRLVIHTGNNTILIRNTKTKEWSKISYDDFDIGIQQAFNNLDGISHPNEIGMMQDFVPARPIFRPQIIAIDDQTEAGKVIIGDVDTSGSEWFYDIYLEMPEFNFDGMMITIVAGSQIGTDSAIDYDYAVVKIGDTTGSFKPSDKQLNSNLRNEVGTALQSVLHEPRIAEWIKQFHEKATG